MIKKGGTPQESEVFLIYQAGTLNEPTVPYSIHLAYSQQYGTEWGATLFIIAGCCGCANEN